MLYNSAKLFFVNVKINSWSFIITEASFAPVLSRGYLTVVNYVFIFFK